MSTTMSTRTERVPAARQRGAGPGRRRSRWRTRAELTLLLGPAVALFLLFVLLPIGIAVRDGFYKWNGVGPVSNWIGLGNYRQALADPIFRMAIWHNVEFALLTLLIQLPLALGLALMLNRPIWGRGVLRLLVFTPYVLSEAITAVIWLTMLQPDGAVDQTMRGLGLGALVHQWLADRGIVLFTLFAVITWKYLGFGIILLLAGLQGIPVELKEAAALDGATAWQTTRRITLPLLASTIRIWIFLSIIGALQLFDLIWIMTLGGPAGASGTLATYLIDRGFRRYAFGFGSAVAVILFLICAVFALLYQRFVLRRDTAGGTTRMVN